MRQRRPAKNRSSSPNGAVKIRGYPVYYEALKLMNENEADEDLQIIDVLVKDGQLVEYGQPLFVVRQG
jgi:hypothetical protein